MMWFQVKENKIKVGLLLKHKYIKILIMVRMSDEEGSSPEFKKKILEEVKKLTNHGKHKEASELFKIYFPDITGGTDGKN